MVITTRARELKEEGKAVIGFGAGEPDFPTPAHIVAAAAAAGEESRAHHYSPAGGLPELKKAIAAAMSSSPALNEIVVTNGGKQAVYEACSVLLDPGHEVLLPAPYWVSYPEAVKLAGGTPVVIDAGADLKVTVDSLEAARTERTKLLIFGSPCNPTGVVYESAEVAAIGRWAAEHGIWVLSDEIYEHLVYGDAEFASMPVVAPEVADRCVVVHGVSKTYAMTGWRVGWMLAPAEIAAAATALQSHLSSNVANVSQMAALAALTGGLDSAHEMRKAFDERRKQMVKLLQATEGVSLIVPQGAMYTFPDVSELMAKRGIADSMELAATLLDEIEIAAVPGDAFGSPGHMRFSFALSDEDLVEGLTRFQKWAG